MRETSNGATIFSWHRPRAPGFISFLRRQFCKVIGDNDQRKCDVGRGILLRVEISRSSQKICCNRRHVVPGRFGRKSAQITPLFVESIVAAIARRIDLAGSLLCFEILADTVKITAFGEIVVDHFIKLASRSGDFTTVPVRSRPRDLDGCFQNGIRRTFQDFPIGGRQCSVAGELIHRGVGCFLQ